MLGDVNRVRQILINLLSNAVKFTRAGEVVVTVSARCGQLDETQGQTVGAWQDDDPSMCVVQIDVRDTGIGIAHDRMGRLFRPFSQGDNDTARTYGGTGLGLAISKRLAEMMGGTIWAESVVDTGSIFHVTFQAQRANEEPPAYLRRAMPALQDKRMLIVDDNEASRHALVTQLATWGLQPYAVSSGEEALQVLHDQGDTYDMALIDLHMHGIDGTQLAAQLRSETSAIETPLVLMSSLGYRLDVDNLSLFASILTKPIKPSVLLETIMAVLVGTDIQSRSRFKRPPMDRRDGGTVSPVDSCWQKTTRSTRRLHSSCSKNWATPLRRLQMAWKC
ncbi:MAG: response regulator [Chloroflexaceae bacterium]|nr:response regulator [Chloroflexaceae bacterium]